MIIKNNKNITSIFYGQKIISSVYKGTRLIWTKLKNILSCFSNGYWIDEYPWKDEYIWSDNTK